MMTATIAVVAGAWAVLAGFLFSRRRDDPIWAWCAVIAVALAGATVDGRAAGAAAWAGFALAVSLPRGRLSRGRAALVAAGAAGAAPLAFGEGPARVAGAVALAAFAAGAVLRRYRAAAAAERTRLQWFGWGVVVAGAIGGATMLVRVMLDWPSIAPEIVAGATLFVPLALALAVVEPVAVRIDRLLVRSIEVGGIMLMVGATYLVVVLGFGDAPDESERRVLGLSMVAAVIAAALFVPARLRLLDVATRRVYGERRAPDEPLQTFGARMSRAVPLDELLLQLAESLNKSMQLVSAEVWTGSGGVLERAASVPDRPSDRIRVGAEELPVVARAHVSGNAWLQVWLPALLARHPERIVRVAPLAHSGELLGVVVCARRADARPFTDEEDRVLTELARQVALALHNSVLDSALAASLDDLRVANEELRASRARIVAAADQSRRQIERNLHDGAQQHLVALAVKLGLARQLAESDTSALTAMLDELRADAQQTLTELRELAHGIYPPLLMDRGLPEALRAAANRAALPTDVAADVGRYAPEVEAAVYFCVLEALQNAGKHAGDGARVVVTLRDDGGELCFEVADDGAGFDATSGRRNGHGFVNMADRVGAVGGHLEVDSVPGRGTRVRGRLPAGGR
jgi:signal transduction histidine kinase